MAPPRYFAAGWTFSGLIHHHVRHAVSRRLSHHDSLLDRFDSEAPEAYAHPVLTHSRRMRFEGTATEKNLDSLVSQRFDAVLEGKAVSEGGVEEGKHGDRSALAECRFDDVGVDGDRVDDREAGGRGTPVSSRTSGRGRGCIDMATPSCGWTRARKTAGRS